MNRLLASLIACSLSAADLQQLYNAHDWFGLRTGRLHAAEPGAQGGSSTWKLFAERSRTGLT